MARRPWWQSFNVRFGSLADIRADMRDVRFTPNSGHAHRRHQCLLGANSGREPACTATVGPFRSEQYPGRLRVQCYACYRNEPRCNQGAAL
jgi:hypothetical protein